MIKKTPPLEFGSFFHETDIKNMQSVNHDTITNNARFFYNGRHAIKFLIDSINEKKTINTFWLPEYYCQHVTAWLKACYSNIKTYPVDPSNKQTAINVDGFINKNDVILINNFWGTATCNIISNKKDVFTVVEDHSHGWLSESCTRSNADYCFASLRKSLPIPLGGIAWSPLKKEIKNTNYPKANIYNTVWENTLEAMRKKARYLNGDTSSIIKSDFLNLVNTSELTMHQNQNIEALHPNHLNYIKSWLPLNVMHYKLLNTQTLYKHLKAHVIAHTLQNQTPNFGLTFYFKHLNALNAFKAYLIENNVYPSLLWPDNPKQYGYYLNLHIDYRYNESHIKVLAQILNNYTFN